MRLSQNIQQLEVRKKAAETLISEAETEKKTVKEPTEFTVAKFLF